MPWSAMECHGVPWSASGTDVGTTQIPNRLTNIDSIEWIDGIDGIERLTTTKEIDDTEV